MVQCYGLEETMQSVAQVCTHLSKLPVSPTIYSEVSPTVYKRVGLGTFVRAHKYGRRAV